MKKAAIISSIAILSLLVGAYVYFAGKEYVYRFSESQIQESLQEKLPLTNTYFFIIQVSLKNPRVQLENGSNRVNAGLDVEFNITVNNNPNPLGGSVDASGGIRYVSEEGQFLLTDPVIERMSVQGISQEYLEKANSARTKALADYYSKHPIYTLSTLDAKQTAARMVLKNVVVENRELVITLGI